MTHQELKKDLDLRYQRMSKADFINLCTGMEPRERVGGPKGKGRLTAKQALTLLGVRYA